MTNLHAVWRPKQSEFDLFADVSGDDNPIHVDPEFSARTAFGRTVSHGMLVYTKLWGMVCAANPGVKSVSQKMMFPNPCFTGEDLDLKVEGSVPGFLQMTATRISDGAVVFSGEAEVA